MSPGSDPLTSHSAAGLKLLDVRTVVYVNETPVYVNRRALSRPDCRERSRNLILCKRLVKICRPWQSGERNDSERNRHGTTVFGWRVRAVSKRSRNVSENTTLMQMSRLSEAQQQRCRVEGCQAGAGPKNVARLSANRLAPCKTVSDIARPKGRLRGQESSQLDSIGRRADETYLEYYFRRCRRADSRLV